MACRCFLTEKGPFDDTESMCKDDNVNAMQNIVNTTVHDIRDEMCPTFRANRVEH